MLLRIEDYVILDRFWFRLMCLLNIFLTTQNFLESSALTFCMNSIIWHVSSFLAGNYLPLLGLFVLGVSIHLWYSRVGSGCMLLVEIAGLWGQFIIFERRCQRGTIILSKSSRVMQSLEFTIAYWATRRRTVHFKKACVGRRLWRCRRALNEFLTTWGPRWCKSSCFGLGRMWRNKGLHDKERRWCFLNLLVWIIFYAVNQRVD